jgi:hypothetical protein
MTDLSEQDWKLVERLTKKLLARTRLNNIAGRIGTIEEDVASILQCLRPGDVFMGNVVMPTTHPDGGTLDNLIGKYVRDIAELSDRTSPADQPEMMLITQKEMADTLRLFFVDAHKIVSCDTVIRNGKGGGGE